MADGVGYSPSRAARALTEHENILLPLHASCSHVPGSVRATRLCAPMCALCSLCQRRRPCRTGGLEQRNDTGGNEQVDNLDLGTFRPGLRTCPPRSNGLSLECLRTLPRTIPRRNSPSRWRMKDCNLSSKTNGLTVCLTQRRAGVSNHGQTDQHGQPVRTVKMRTGPRRASTNLRFRLG